jgi:membrane protease YdiL (CAAX protease family)
MPPSTSSSDSFFADFGFVRLFLLVLSLVFLDMSVQVGVESLLGIPLLSAGLASVLVMLLLPLGLLRSVGAPLREILSPVGLDLRQLLLLTLLTLAAAFPVDWLTGWNLQLVPPPEELAAQMAELRPQSPLGWGMAIAVLAVLAPMGEELIFRGLLLGGAQVAMGSRQALFLSSALFAAAHLQPYYVAGLFVVGLILGTVYQRTRSLVACVYVHGLYNLLSLAGWEAAGAEETQSWTDGPLGPLLAVAGAIIAWWALRRLAARRGADPTSTIERWSDPD